MGCGGGCGKSVAGNAGRTANTAVMVGEVNNSVIRVRVNRDVLGFMSGAIKYVRGEGVQALLDSGDLVQLAGGARVGSPIRKGTTLYYVDGVGYADISTARVRSEQTGHEIVIKTIGA